ncbi:unnamed protein product [Protopolystoma xenopodis]|uniref:Uncharacterized protein n=1 Tax=Protopolystoma xenopodis TaxID=117903 RepID=A0A448X2I1_9PLAT|nr:unnamed protein product [Protopolystoma xenopodis]
MEARSFLPTSFNRLAHVPSTLPSESPIPILSKIYPLPLVLGALEQIHTQACTRTIALLRPCWLGRTPLRPIGSGLTPFWLNQTHASPTIVSAQLVFLILSLLPVGISLFLLLSCELRLRIRSIAVVHRLCRPVKLP